MQLFERVGFSKSEMLQLNDREPRENRGRLRHCNGIQTPRATEPEIRDWEGGSEVKPEVRIPI